MKNLQLCFSFGVLLFLGFLSSCQKEVKSALPTVVTDSETNVLSNAGTECSLCERLGYFITCYIIQYVVALRINLLLIYFISGIRLGYFFTPKVQNRYATHIKKITQINYLTISQIV